MGVFETFRSYAGGVLWRFDEHWARWQASADLCDLKIPVPKSKVASMLAETLSDGSEVRFRLWSDGEAWEIEVSSLPVLPELVVINDASYVRENPQAKHDGHDYAQFFDLEVFETIWFDDRDELVEGNITNVFAVIEGKLCTPPQGNLLPGLMRTWVLDNFEVEERVISRADLGQATEIILTNMVRGIVSVDRWEQWHSGTPAMAQRLQSNLTCQIAAAL